jgi:hypothetical protein
VSFMPVTPIRETCGRSTKSYRARNSLRASTYPSRLGIKIKNPDGPAMIRAREAERSLRADPGERG